MEIAIVKLFWPTLVDNLVIKETSLNWFKQVWALKLELIYLLPVTRKNMVKKFQ